MSERYVSPDSRQSYTPSILRYNFTPGSFGGRGGDGHGGRIGPICGIRDRRDVYRIGRRRLGGVRRAAAGRG